MDISRDQNPGANLEAIAKSLVDAMSQGSSVAETGVLSDEALEAMYAAGYGLYEGRKYEKASKVFQSLCYYNHYEKKYFMGLAGCLQMMKHYEHAISVYSYASLLDCSDPNPPLQAANCHGALGQYKEAISGYAGASHFAGSNPEYKSLKEFADAMQAKLEHLHGGGVHSGN